MIFGKRVETTVAGNPGGIAIKPLVYARYYPYALKRFLLGAFFVLLGVVVAIATKGVSLLFLYFGMRTMLDGQRRLRNLARHYRLGNVLAAIVVNTEPFTLAAFAELSTGRHASYPAVKIVPHPLGKVRGRTFVTGDRVPCVAQYSGQMPTPKWDNFNPLPAVFATDDEAELARVEASIPEAYWDELNEAMFQIPKPYRNGLFTVLP